MRTILVLFGDFSSVVLLLLLLEGGGGIEQDCEVEDADLLVEDLLVDLVLAFVGDLDAQILIEIGVLLMILMRS
jgi:hypothetical protein